MHSSFYRLLIIGILMLCCFSGAVYIYSNDSVDIEYYQISESVASTNTDVNIIELSNKIILTSDTKEPIDIKISNPKYKTYQINHYDDNGTLIETKTVSATDLISITNWSTYDIIGIDNITYGDGWTHYDYLDGTSTHTLRPTNYLRWDGEWRPISEMNVSSGDWPYLVEDFETYYLITRIDDNITLQKASRTYDFQPYKIGVTLTTTPAQLNAISTYQNVSGMDYWYITIPQSLKETAKHLNWDNKLPTISNETGFILNQSDNFTGEWLPNYKYVNVGGELRLYYNQVARSFGIASTEVIFVFNSYVINSSTSWANTSYSNFAYDRNTGYLILPDNVTDGLVLYQKMSGSSGITSYDMNLTSDNNGTLVNMNTGLDNGSSGWNSSGKFGNALAFDGVDDYVNAGAGTSLDLSGQFTIGMWWKSTTNSETRMAIGDGVAAATPRKIGILNTGKIFIRVIAAGSSDSTINAPSIDIWHYIVVTRDALNKVDLYIDDGSANRLFSDGAQSGNFVVKNIGAGSGDSGLSQFFSGSIDSVRIYNHALTNDEINQTMLDTMVTSNNITHWHNAGVDYQTASFIVNMTTPTDTNYTVWYANNGSSFTQIGDVYTDNQSIPITGTKYQNTDLRVIMNGNSTTTPEEIEVTFVTEAAADDTSFTVTLPASETQINFTAVKSIDTLLQPDGQNSTVPIVVVENTGNIAQSFRFYMNSTVSNILTYTSLANDLSNPVEINTTTTTVIISDLAASGSDDVWMYCNLTRPSPGSSEKTLTVNSSS